MNPEERKIRTQKYINLSEKKLRAFYEKHLGTHQNVLFESQKNGDHMSGFTENYIRVDTLFREELINELTKVKLKSILPNGNVSVELT